MEEYRIVWNVEALDKKDEVTGIVYITISCPIQPNGHTPFYIKGHLLGPIFSYNLDFVS